MHLGLRQSILNSRIISVCIIAVGYWFLGASSFETIFLDTTTKIQLPKRLFSGYHYPAQEVFSSTPLTIEVIPNCWAFLKQPPTLFSTFFWPSTNPSHKFWPQKKLFFALGTNSYCWIKIGKKCFNVTLCIIFQTYKQYIYHS